MRARDNPFAMDRIHAIRYRPQRGTFAEILIRLKELNHRAAIVGPDGSGKTTLMEDLEKVLTTQGVRTRMVFVNDLSPLTDPACRRLLSELAREEVLLLDGADLVPRSCWSLLKRHTITHASGLVITSHRPGLLPTLIECTTSLALLQEIARELQPPDRPIPLESLESLFRRHQGNIRSCLRDLYDLYAQDDCIRLRASDRTGI
jgi:energy-coupling factor transporter ATP-binding protein EcfA2